MYPFFATIKDIIKTKMDWTQDGRYFNKRDVSSAIKNELKVEINNRKTIKNISLSIYLTKNGNKTIDPISKILSIDKLIKPSGIL
jgi:hypothetical protein